VGGHPCGRTHNVLRCSATLLRQRVAVSQGALGVNLGLVNGNVAALPSHGFNELTGLERRRALRVPSMSIHMELVLVSRPLQQGGLPCLRYVSLVNNSMR
jgi:hypothetical protein